MSCEHRPRPTDFLQWTDKQDLADHGVKCLGLDHDIVWKVIQEPPARVQTPEFKAIPPSGYYHYINSDEWKAKRHEFLERYGWKCEACGTTKRLITLHHLTYERLGSELDSDLKALCQPCHERTHLR